MGGFRVSLPPLTNLGAMLMHNTHGKNTSNKKYWVATI